MLETRITKGFQFKPRVGRNIAFSASTTTKNSSSFGLNKNISCISYIRDNALNTEHLARTTSKNCLHHCSPSVQLFVVSVYPLHSTLFPPNPLPPYSLITRVGLSDVSGELCFGLTITTITCDWTLKAVFRDRPAKHR